MADSEREHRLTKVHTQRLAQLGTLLAGFAHEVRNPLSTIGLNLQLVLEDFEEAQSARDKRAKKRLSTVEGEVRRLQKIVEEFLSYARAPEPKLQPTDLNGKLSALVEFHDLEMKEAGLSLRFYPDNQLGEVPCDWDHVQSAVANLIRNARDATPAGGEVLVSTLRDGDFVIVRVTDTGSGIEPEQAGRILEPYVSNKKGGTGLGLPTARRVAEDHGGTLTMQSDSGKGTQFSLRLPRRSPAT
ncbi:MAG: PAS domain-containing sensor histidine kinase [Planctomycetota bacterium]